MTGWGQALLRIGEGVAWTSDDTRVVAMDLTEPGASPFVLEASAASVWELIAAHGPIDGDALLSRLAAAFDIAVADIREGVETLLSDLVDRNLISDRRPT